MPEEVRTEEVVNEPLTTETVEVPQSDGLATALADSFFNATPVEQKVVETKPKEEVVTPPEETEEIFDEVDYLKDFGWENKEKGKEEIKSLREKAAQVEKGFEWKNDYSKQVAEILNEGEGKEEELFNILNTKRQLKKLATSEITDTKLAAELVKFGIQNENKEAKLSPDEVEFLFNERYSIPAKPVQGDLEDDADYEHKVTAWQQQVSNMEKRMIIEAKMQQPKLSAYQNELVLPSIKKEESVAPSNQPTQEQLAKFESDKAAFLQSATQSLNSFDGFKVQVKDKDVDYTVAYVPSPEEKKIVETKINQFVQSGFDANALFFDRWLKEDGSIDQNLVVEDYMSIITKEKANNKLVTDAVGKRMEAYITSKKRPNINSQQQQGTFTPVVPKSEPEAVTEAWLNMR